MKNRIFFDTEFIEDGKTITLLSIGMVSSTGHTYYAEVLESHTLLHTADDWVKTNVIPHLYKHIHLIKPRDEIKADIIRFVGHDPEFWADYCSYDWVALCQLFGKMIDLPKGWPMFCNDLQQFMREVGKTDLEDVFTFISRHHALEDALHARSIFEYLLGYQQEKFA